jgi:signal transduction histidine kinase
MKLLEDRHSIYMIKIILFGTLIVSVLLFTLLLISLFVLDNPNLVSRTVAGALVLLYLITIFLFLRKLKYKLAAWMLLILYASVAVVIISNWGINAPVGIIIVGFVILLSGVMLGSRYIIPVTCVLMLILFVIFILDISGIHEPNLNVLSMEPGFGDIATYVTFFGIFALIAWISENRMEQSLAKAISAERALEKEKLSLAQRLEEQIQIVRQSQREEIMQLYRFAELGQLTTAILHEMANNLSVLSLDIDDLHQENHTSNAIARTKESIKYLENMVMKVRRLLNKTNQTERFDAIKVVRDMVKELSNKPNQPGIRVSTSNNPKFFYVIGDPLRLSQIITILVNNSIDASLQVDTTKEILITIKLSDTNLLISVTDYGIGIPKDIRKNLFEPLHSTKQNGLGIGLFIAKQIIETHFKGDLSLDPNPKHTKFIIKLPKG